MRSTRGALAAIGFAGVLGVALRLHFLSVPLTTDEGGYATVARLWSQGYRLYGDVAWVDRPQGLLVLYRIAGAGGSDAIRLLAIAGGLVTTLAVAAVAWALAGRRAAVIGATLCALLGPAPHLEGFTANGELLAEAFAATAIAAAAWWTVRRSDRLLLLAGLTAAIAPLVKQSAIDGVVVVAVLVLVGSQRRSRDLAVLATGAAAPLIAALASAAAVGIGDWWYAVVGYRSGTESVVSGDVGARLRLLGDAVPPALQDLAPLLVGAGFGLAAARRAGRLLVPGTWLAAGAAGFLGGGLYHPHYWVQLIAPLAVAAAIGLDALLARPAVAAGLVVASSAVVVAYSAEVYTTGSAAAISTLTSHDSRLAGSPAVGRKLAALSSSGQPVYVIWANAAVYWYADRPPAFRYLWFLNVARIPGAREAVISRLTGPNPPVAVAVYQRPDAIDSSGAVERTLAARYVLVERVAGIPVYRLRTPP